MRRREEYFQLQISYDCTKVTDIDERRKIVVKYKRRFQCLRKGHQVKKCRDKVACSNWQNRSSFVKPK